MPKWRFQVAIDDIIDDDDDEIAYQQDYERLSNKRDRCWW
jgi:hypothetical protein